MTDSRSSKTRLRSRGTFALAVAILIPSLWGFGSKFFEFVAVFRGEADGAFAVSPILNYLLASLGFLLLFLWATANGMFHDIEKPKHTMLDVEAQLDRQSNSGAAVPIFRDR